VTVAAGKITIAYNNEPKINGKNTVMSPSFTGGSVTWTCKGADTTVDGKYLPSACR
jgi:hypothetical protein